MTGGNQRALQAVRRVREVRERDSLIGLQRARTTHLERQAAAQAAQERLDGAPGFDRGTPADFVGHRALLTGLAEARSATQTRLQRSQTLTDEAQRRWQQDRNARRAVELLLERREEERRVERDRREASTLDDLAGQAWQRRRTTASRRTAAGGDRG